MRKSADVTMPLPTYRVLAAVGPLERSASEILETMRRQGKAGAPSLASFYRHLKRADEAGWLEIVARDGEGEGEPGRPGQVYRLTAAGHSAVRTEARRLRELAALADASALRSAR